MRHWYRLEPYYDSSRTGVYLGKRGWYLSRLHSVTGVPLWLWRAGAKDRARSPRARRPGGERKAFKRGSGDAQNDRSVIAPLVARPTKAVWISCLYLSNFSYPLMMGPRNRVTDRPLPRNGMVQIYEACSAITHHSGIPNCGAINATYNGMARCVRDGTRQPVSTYIGPGPSARSSLDTFEHGRSSSKRTASAARTRRPSTRTSEPC